MNSYQIQQKAKEWAEKTPKQLQKSALRWKDLADGRMPRGIRLRKYVGQMLVIAGISEIGFQDSRSARLSTRAIYFLKEWVNAIRELSEPNEKAHDEQIQLYLFPPEVMFASNSYPS